MILYLFGVSPAVCRSFFAGREVPAELAVARQGHAVRAVRDLAAHERPRLPEQEPGRRARFRQLARGVRARPLAPDLHAASRVRGDRRRGRRRVAPAQREPAADRERVLQLHPPEARRPLRRAADHARCCAAACSTSRCARWTSAPTTRSASTSASCSSSRPSPRSACCARARRSRAELSDKYEANHVTVASRGREPGLALWTERGALPLADWATEMLDQMQGICELLDAGDASRPYSAALAFQRAEARWTRPSCRRRGCSTR